MNSLKGKEQRRFGFLAESEFTSEGAMRKTFGFSHKA
jgi:hypothetical protein